MAGAELQRQVSNAVMPKEALVLLLEDSPRDAELIERELRRGGFASSQSAWIPKKLSARHSNILRLT